MSTAGVVLGIVSIALLVVLLVIVVVRWHGPNRGSSRTSDDVAELQAQIRALTASVDDLRSREMSAPQPTLASSESDSSGDVPLITGMPESDDVDVRASRVASVTLAAPLMKVATLSYGLRYALHEERRMRVSYAMRKELRRQRKMRRRRRAQRSRSEGWVP